MRLPASILVPAVALALLAGGAPAGILAAADRDRASRAAQDDEVDSPSRSWKRASSNNFVAVGDTSEGFLYEALTELEVFRAALFSLAPVLPAPRFGDRTPLLVLFASASAFAPFTPRDSDGDRRTGVDGFHLNDLTGTYLVTYAADAGSGDRLQVVLHEYAHEIFRITLGAHLPPWLDEGLAELSESVGAPAGNSPVKGRYLGRPLETHVRALRAAGGPRVAEMLEVDGLELEAMSPTEATLFYAKSWALVHYLLLERSDPRPDDVPAFLAALATGQPAAAAFEAAFRVEVASIDATLAQYVQQSAFPAIEVEDVAPRLGTLAAEPMAESIVDRLRGRLFLRLPDVQNAEEALTRALALDPGSPETRVALAGLRLREHRTAEAIDLLIPIASAESPDAAALVTLGRAWQQARRFDEAFDAFTAATLADASRETRIEAVFGRSLAARSDGMEEEAAASMADLQRIAPAARWYFARARGLWAAGKDALAIADVRTILASPGATTSDKCYAAVVGALSARRLQQPNVARDLLAQAASVAEVEWTRTVLAYLQDDLSDREFLSEADGRGDETEARTYIGLTASLSGRLDDAREHLTWVRDNGWPGRDEYDMARAELARIDAPGE